MSTLLLESIQNKDAASPSIYINAAGNVGVGTVSPAYPLTLGNNKQFGSLNTAGAAVTLALLNNSNNLVFGDDSVNTGSLTVQSRAETRFVTNGVERLRILSTGGITFNGDTAAANALDDYEEGTWTPKDVNGTPLTLTGGGVAGQMYTKVGRVVTLHMDIAGNASTAGNVISNIPFAGTSNGGQAGVLYNGYVVSGPPSGTSGHVYGTSIYLYEGPTAVSWVNGGRIIANCVYFTDA